MEWTQIMEIINTVANAITQICLIIGVPGIGAYEIHKNYRKIHPKLTKEQKKNKKETEIIKEAEKILKERGIWQEEDHQEK